MDACWVTSVGLRADSSAFFLRDPCVLFCCFKLGHRPCRDHCHCSPALSQDLGHSLPGSVGVSEEGQYIVLDRGHSSYTVASAQGLLCSPWTLTFCSVDVTRPQTVTPAVTCALVVMDLTHGGVAWRPASSFFLFGGHSRARPQGGRSQVLSCVLGNVSWDSH